MRPPASQAGPSARAGAPRGGPTDPSHDEALRRGILPTEISRRGAIAFVAAFLALVAAPPVAQIVVERVRGEDSVLPTLLERWPKRAHLAAFEQDLEEASYLRGWVQPRLQLLLTRAGRVGNKKVVVGRDGWLYYKPGVLAVAGPGLLDPGVLAQRRRDALDAGEPAVHPDPRPAILGLARALAARGVRLVLLPVPDKAGVELPRLAPRRTGGAARAHGNPDEARLWAELRAAGVLVFDPAPAAAPAGDAPRFLIQDTHWTPAFMAEVARGLAAFVAREVPLPAPARRPIVRTAPEEVARVGDLVDMLKLPDEQTLFLPQRVTIVRVLAEAAGGEVAPLEPQPDADVLLLGDSFTNIYSSSTMGWGEGAGLGPQLALALGRPVDVIARNDAGAFATRALLAEALAAGEDRLAGKRVVIWEFAARELAVGDWRPLSYDLGASR
jgi:alginate O-acetyltransferase complex protein AlgJ